MRRVQAIERRASRRHSLLAFQDDEDPDQFRSNGQIYTSAELDQLAEQGWEIIKVVYAEDWREDDEIDAAS